MLMILSLDNLISGLDFNLLGTVAASIDEYGVCLVSDIDTNDYSFHLKTETRSSSLSNHLLFIYRNLFPVSSSSYHGICFSSCDFYRYWLTYINKGSTNRCRWIPNSEEHLIYVKYDDSMLNVLDAQKGVLTLKNSVLLESVDHCNFLNFHSAFRKFTCYFRRDSLD